MKKQASEIRRPLLASALKKFAKAKSKTVADFLHRNYPEHWPTLEKARSQVRYYRGNSGKYGRKELASDQFVRPNGSPHESPFPELPEGLTSFEDWSPLEISGPSKILVLSDIHVPYHDRECLEMAVERGYDASVVILNGDFMDCFELSKFQPDPRKCDFPGAIVAARQTLEWLRKKFPKARIIYKEGNHDERLERYLVVRAPALLGVPEFEMSAALHLSEYGIEWLGDKRPMLLGKLYLIHGHEYRVQFTNPVNPARGLFLRAKVSAMCGHYHQWSADSKKDLGGKIISCWSTGCLCDLRPEYMPINEWSHGYAIVEIGKEGEFQVENFRIIHGQSYL